MSKKKKLVFTAIVLILIILFSKWHDKWLSNKYTEVLPIWLDESLIIKDDNEIIELFNQNSQMFYNFVDFIKEKHEYPSSYLFYLGYYNNWGQIEYAKSVYEMIEEYDENKVRIVTEKPTLQTTDLEPKERNFLEELYKKQMISSLRTPICVYDSKKEGMNLIDPIIYITIDSDGEKGIRIILKYQTDFTPVVNMKYDNLILKKVIKLEGNWYFLVEQFDGKIFY